MNSKATSVILVRHGETLWNIEKRLQGNMNSPLTENGIRQAEDTGIILDKIKIDSVYSSPLERAYKTAEIITGNRNLKISVKENLREINLGPWEGKTKEETRISDPLEYYNFWNEPEKFNLEGAENFKNLQNRMAAQLSTILDENEGKTVLVVSHWIAIMAAAAHFKSSGLSSGDSQINLSNGKFLVLQKKGESLTLCEDLSVLDN